MVKKARKTRAVTPGCKRVNLTLPNELLAALAARVRKGNRSRFLSYCARARLAVGAADREHWDRMIRELLDE